jgi:lysozyme family protein
MANYRSRVSGMLYDEGGLSKSPLDTTAARNPVPDGSGNHTNKGVTWAAFSMLGPKLGYKATPQLFYSMPQEVWLKIYKVGFWDQIKGDQIKSQAIADMVVDIAFHSGVGRAGQLTQRALNRLGQKPPLPESTKFGSVTLAAVNKQSRTKSGETALLAMITKVRMEFLQSLSTWESFKNGWTKRVMNLYDSGMELIKKNTGGIGIVIGALALGTYWWYKK